MPCTPALQALPTPNAGNMLEVASLRDLDIRTFEHLHQSQTPQVLTKVEVTLACTACYVNISDDIIDLPCTLQLHDTRLFSLVAHLISAASVLAAMLNIMDTVLLRP
jgi:hypothetical protein